ncbi:MAG: hypothetical protein KKD92_14415 [Proteobacteria bacterium]|nr:hypothetical protein [Pseudomonadota bacterium]
MVIKLHTCENKSCYLFTVAEKYLRGKVNLGKARIHAKAFFATGTADDKEADISGLFFHNFHIAPVID